MRTNDIVAIRNYRGSITTQTSGLVLRKDLLAPEELACAPCGGLRRSRAASSPALSGHIGAVPENAVVEGCSVS